MNSTSPRTHSAHAAARYLAAASLFATATLAQPTIPAGYDATVRTLPAGATAVYDLPGPGIVYYDGSALVLDDGTATTDLLSFPPGGAPAFASFTIPFGPNAVVFGESDGNDIWFVPLTGGLPRLVANVVFNYDAIRISPTEILVSAKTGGFAVPDNDLVRIDVGTGATEFIGSVPGFSGPLAIDRAGNVFYGLGDELVRFPAAAVTAATATDPLDITDATSIVTGLGATLKMAVDADGDLFVSDFSGNVLEVSTDDRNPTRVRTFATIAGFADPIVFRDAPDLAAFEPFQPDFGKGLWFAGGGSLVSVRPARPAVAAPTGPIPAGPFAVDLSDGPASGLAALLVGDASSNLPLVASLPGVEQPLFLEVGAILTTVDVGTLDPSGAVSVGLSSPGALGVEFAIQFAIVDTSGPVAVLGTSEATTLAF